MSVRVMAQVWEHSAAAGTELLVLLAVADVANDDGHATAYARSQAVLAGKCRVSEDTIRRAVRSLSGEGGARGDRPPLAVPELEVLQRGDGRRSTSYRVRLEVYAARAQGSQNATPQPEAPGVAERDPRGRADATPGVARMPPQGSRPRDPHLSVLPHPFPSSVPSPAGGPAADASGEYSRRRLEPELRDRAQAVLAPWWERQSPKPAVRYVAARVAVADVLRAGWSPEEVTEALDVVPTITTRWLESELRRRAGKVTLTAPKIVTDHTPTPYRAFPAPEAGPVTDPVEARRRVQELRR